MKDKPSKQEKIQANRQKIINALKRLLAKGAYSDISVQIIAQEAGYSKGGLLHYFATKEEMYSALIEDIFQGFVKNHENVFRSQLDQRKTTSMSALVSAEDFVFEHDNIRIIMNLILYGFADKSIMNTIKRYLMAQRRLYTNLINENKNRLAEILGIQIEAKELARICQAMVIFLGILEQIDPSGIDHLRVVQFASVILGAI